MLGYRRVVESEQQSHTIAKVAEEDVMSIQDCDPVRRRIHVIWGGGYMLK
jgi:hypothetical protein